MEFDGNLSKIQGALLSLKKRNLLNSNVSDGEVTTTLKDVISNMTEDEKRKVTYYMVLNTNLSITEKLKEDENIYLLINDPVLLERKYLIKYIYSLNLENYLFDIIQNSSSLITVEIIEDLIIKLKEPEFHKTQHGIEHMFELLKAIYVKIYKIEKNCDDEGGDKLLKYFNEIYLVIKISSQAFFHNSVLSNYTVAECLGEVFYLTFESILYFANVEKYVNYVDMYKIEILEVRNCKNVKDLTGECRKIFIEDLKKGLEGITIDLWMSWLESYKGNQTYQEAIGNIVYELCEFKNFIPPDILIGLSAFKIKPKSPEISEIINKINNGEENWFKYLIENFNSDDEKSLECVLKNSQLADYEDVERVLEKLCNCDSDLEISKKIILKFVKLSKISKWLGVCLKKENMVCESFNEDLIETFNKITNDKIEVWDVLCLFIQNSQKTLCKICECGVYNPNKIEFLIEILKQVENFDYKGKTDLGKIFLNILEEINNKYKKNLISFVNSLKKENLLNCEFFNLLIEKIENNLKDSKEVVEELDILKCVAVSFVPDCDVLVLLCEISEFLEYFSWDLYNFNKTKLTSKELLEDVVQILLKEFRKENPTQDRINFLKSFIVSKSETTQAVFCDLWFEFGENWLGSGKYYNLVLALTYTNHSSEFLYKLIKEPEEFVFIRSSIIISLYMVLPVLTYRKWETLYNRLLSIVPEGKSHLPEMMDIFLSVLYFLSEKLNKNKNILPCYEQCVRNFGRLMKSHAKKTNADVAGDIIEKILFLLSAVEDEDIRKNSCLILSSVVLDFVEIAKKGENKNLLEKLELGLEILEIGDVTDVIKKKLTE